MSVKTTSSNAPRYSLSADQKKKIIALLNLSDDKAPTILEALERLVRVDGWLGFSSTGEVIKDKLAARRVRDFNSVSHILERLVTVLSKIDPVVAGHIDDQFSLLQFEMSQIREAEKTSRRKVLPLWELITQLQKWSEYSAQTIKASDGSGYLARFLNELEDFWLLHISDSLQIDDIKLYKLTNILVGIEEDTARKQVTRWREPEKVDKSKG
jgi:hypothetical protein